MRAWWALLACAGCEQLLGLEAPVQPVDAKTNDVAFDAPGCPPGYTPFSSETTVYRFDATPISWLDAAQACADDGAHLAVIGTLEEYTTLEQMLGQPTVWIGLSDLITAQQHIWVTDELVQTAPRWAVGEPDMTADRCTTFDAGRLYDRDCAMIFGYLCECDAYPNDPGNYTP